MAGIDFAGRSPPSTCSAAPCGHRITDRNPPSAPRRRSGDSPSARRRSAACTPLAAIASWRADRASAGRRSGCRRNRRGSVAVAVVDHHVATFRCCSNVRAGRSRRVEVVHQVDQQVTHRRLGTRRGWRRLSRPSGGSRVRRSAQHFGLGRGSARAASIQRRQHQHHRIARPISEEPWPAGCRNRSFPPGP